MRVKTQRTRIPVGQRTGGQFASQARSEPDVQLDAPTRVRRSTRKPISVEALSQLTELTATVVVRHGDGSTRTISGIIGSATTRNLMVCIPQHYDDMDLTYSDLYHPVGGGTWVLIPRAAVIAAQPHERER